MTQRRFNAVLFLLFFLTVAFLAIWLNNGMFWALKLDTPFFSVEVNTILRGGLTVNFMPQNTLGHIYDLTIPGWIIVAIGAGATVLWYRRYGRLVKLGASERTSSEDQGAG